MLYKFTSWNSLWYVFVKTSFVSNTEINLKHSVGGGGFTLYARGTEKDEDKAAKQIEDQSEKGQIEKENEEIKDISG